MTTSLPANELRRDDLILSGENEGWHVQDVLHCYLTEAGAAYGNRDEVTALELRRTWTLIGHDVNGEEIWGGVEPPGEYDGVTGLPTKDAAKRAWMNAEDTVEVARL